MTEIRWRNPLLSLRAPEWVLVMYAFLLHFLWEMVQTPFFAEMPQMAHWPATLMCLKAAVGDVVIAVASFSAVAAVSNDRGWFLSWRASAVVPFVVLGIAITIGLELHAVYWAQRWAYSELMPVLPVLNVGLVPIAQWIMLPLCTLFLLQRHHLGIPQSSRIQRPDLPAGRVELPVD